MEQFDSSVEEGSKSRSSDRKTTSSSVQVVRELTEASVWTIAANETDCMDWSNQRGSLAVGKK